MKEQEFQRAIVGKAALEAALSMWDATTARWGWHHRGSLPVAECLPILEEYVERLASADSVDPAVVAARRLRRHFDAATSDLDAIRSTVRGLATLAMWYLGADDPDTNKAAGLVASTTWRSADFNAVIGVVEALRRRRSEAETEFGRQMIDFRIHNTLGGVMQFEDEYLEALRYHTLALKYAFDERSEFISHLNISEDLLALGEWTQCGVSFRKAIELHGGELDRELNALDISRAMVHAATPPIGLPTDVRSLLERSLTSASNRVDLAADLRQIERAHKILSEGTGA